MKLLCPVIIIIFLMGQNAYSQNKSNYEFDKLDSASSNYLIEMISQTPSEENILMICGALKRIGQIKLACARPEVRSDSSTPSANQNREKKTGHLRKVFNMAADTLGQISTNDIDASILFQYYKEISDAESRYWIVKALGEMSGVKTAILKLNSIIDNLTSQYKSQIDERLIDELLNAIQYHNSKSSVLYLLKLQSRVRLSPDLNDKLNQTVNLLNSGGNMSSTN